MKLGLLARKGDTTDVADAAVEVQVGEARPPGISQFSAATESEVEGSSGEAGSSWPGSDDKTRHVDATVAEAVGEAWPPGIAEHSVATALVPRERVQRRAAEKTGGWWSWAFWAQSKVQEQRLRYSIRQAC